MLYSLYVPRTSPKLNIKLDALSRNQYSSALDYNYRPDTGGGAEILLLFICIEIKAYILIHKTKL